MNWGQNVEQQYLKLLLDLRLQDEVYTRPDRTGTGTYSIFGAQIKHSMSEGFPLLTSKFVPFKTLTKELLWMLRGETNNNGLTAQGVHIWDEWAKPDGDLGPIYGAQWRSWASYTGRDSLRGYEEGYSPMIREPIDQIRNLQKSLKEDPFSRRHIVSAWNVADLPEMALAPCHCFFQCYVVEGINGARKLSLQLYQRSADIFLGVPFNIASYALLLQMLADHCGYEADQLIITYGDLHLYRNHCDQADEQLKRTTFPLPTIVNSLDKVDRANIWEHKVDDYQLLGYQHHPKIEAPVAV
jgi:thymidylate synthase